MRSFSRVLALSLACTPMFFTQLGSPAQALPCYQSGSMRYEVWPDGSKHACGSWQPRSTGPSVADLQRQREAEAAAAAAAAARVRAIQNENALQTANDYGYDLYQHGRYAEAVAAFQEALKYSPDDDILLANLAKAQQKVALQEAARQREFQAARQRELDAAHQRDADAERQRAIEAAQRRALMQARVGAASQGSADCIFDGRNGCKKPMPMATVVSISVVTVPADAAQFLQRIPKDVLGNPAVARQARMYEHFAHERGVLSNNLLAAETAARAHPGDQAAQTKVTLIQGQLAAARKDEAVAQKPLVRFAVAPIDLKTEGAPAPHKQP